MRRDPSDLKPELTPRSYLGILFDCCGVYARIYRDRDAGAYEGRCPRCLRMLRVRVGPNGTNARFFRAGV